MKQSELEALLGRPLTSIEVTNRQLYLDIAKNSLEELLCIKLCDEDDNTRTFVIREGYSTVFTDIFTKLTEVKVDGVVTTDYYPAFWDKRSNAYYNSIVLKERGGDEVTLTGSWGFESVPHDLRQLWAQLFANVAKKYSAGGGNVKSKQTEDFRISYGDVTDDDAFLAENRRVITKYRTCDISSVRHGKTCKSHRRYDCGYCV